MTDPNLVTTGTTITSTWGNAIANRVVNIFASSGARSSAITSPFAGQVTAITSNDASEGLYMQNSAGDWTLPWSDPWGLVVNTDTTTISSSTSGTTELVVATSASFTAVENRNYEINWTCSALGTASGDIFTASIRLTNASGTQYTAKRLGVTTAGQIGLYIPTVTTLTAGSTVLVGTFKRESGTGTLTTVGGLSNRIWVKDIGPSGAPA